MIDYNSSFTSEELQSEIWKPVPDFPLYEVSNLGRVGRRPCECCTCTIKFLKPGLSNGYLGVALYINGMSHRRNIHRLVAAAFIGPCPLGYTVNHEDTIKTNNRADNLNYKTHQEQMDHARDMGRLPAGENHPTQIHGTGYLPHGDNHWTHKHPERLYRGEDHWTHKKPERIARGKNNNKHKLTDAIVREIRVEYAEGKSMIQIARERSVSQVCIKALLAGKTWKHVKQDAPIIIRVHIKLTERDVRKIRKLLTQGRHAPTIAKMFGVSTQQIYSIKYRHKWKHIT